MRFPRSRGSGRCSFRSVCVSLCSLRFSTSRRFGRGVLQSPLAVRSAWRGAFTFFYGTLPSRWEAEVIGDATCMYYSMLRARTTKCVGKELGRSWLFQARAENVTKIFSTTQTPNCSRIKTAMYYGYVFSPLSGFWVMRCSFSVVFSMLSAPSPHSEFWQVRVSISLGSDFGAARGIGIVPCYRTPALGSSGYLQ